MTDTKTTPRRAVAAAAGVAARRATVLFDAGRPETDELALRMLEAATRALAQAGPSPSERAEPVRVHLRMPSAPAAGARTRRRRATHEELRVAAVRVVAVLAETGLVPPKLASKIASALGKQYQRPEPHDDGTDTDGEGTDTEGTGGTSPGTGTEGTDDTGPGDDTEDADPGTQGDDPNDPGRYVAAIAVTADGEIELTAGEEVVVGAPVEAGVPASVAAAVLGLVALVVWAVSVPSDEPVPEEPKPTKEECKKIAAECQVRCEYIFSLDWKGRDLGGLDFHKCVRECKQDAGC